ncbi:hypothetical protein I553_0370 [Mycobacterium xenopi 4042]|uniref:Uncharacterized protein n=1 Tax=Mycobacterium xenopi 4042 TaxID=1299334 RepID=X7YK92_MYCXE|nr:hypothetical protein I553_0370 [Mycobacterium xenopi 4042]
MSAPMPNVPGIFHRGQRNVPGVFPRKSVFVAMQFITLPPRSPPR